MKGAPVLPGGDLEYAVLAVLWHLEAASARQIHSRVGAPRKLVYTTIATVLDRLHAKGLVSRERSGKSFIYRARVSRDVTERARAQAAVERLLGSAPAPAIANLVEAVESIDPALLDEMARAVAARRKSRDG